MCQTRPVRGNCDRRVVMRASLIEKLVVNGCTEMLSPPIELVSVTFDRVGAEVPLLLLVVGAVQHFTADRTTFGRNRLDQRD
jgi:hypothetical protein